MTSRKLPLIYDDLAPGQSYRLERSLASFLPASWTPSSPELPSPSAAELSPTHHLVYFNPAMPADELLPDGTDPLQSPGLPFVRRMWAGGSLRFRPFAGALDTPGRKRPSQDQISLDGSRWVCHEFIRDVQVKGREGEEKVFVGIERRMGKLDEMVERGRAADLAASDSAIRARLWTAEEEEFGQTCVIERRNIVFMRERTPAELLAAAEAVGKPVKILKPQNKPDFTHSLIPTASLLFRYSALTFNAHSIHLDPSYCRKIEGHRDLLVHGPLSLTLLVTMLREHLKTLEPPERVLSFDYRNLAPLYANEPLKLCGRKAEEGKYELWAETPEGGIAVKGMARTGLGEV
ncbi:hypothetical protein AOQ84DRAFT_394704 [Glonium stellatum]|uniref:Uncharacterized protein n=1 Tax=Glonium stellatum TaxID=574774 RepID=A0A8E2JYR0_9PEZI|nr:hypothetical protein AOQ84DRAFT_394704 [Glonium stellatum]